MTCAATLLIAGSIFGQAPGPHHRHRPKFDPYAPTVHDPVLAKEGDTYYLYCTGMGIDAFSSTDLKKWEKLAPCVKELPQVIIEA